MAEALAAHRPRQEGSWSGPILFNSICLEGTPSGSVCPDWTACPLRQRLLVLQNVNPTSQYTIHFPWRKPSAAIAAADFSQPLITDPVARNMILLRLRDLTFPEIVHSPGPNPSPAADRSTPMQHG
jgi:hypothetical protein